MIRLANNARKVSRAGGCRFCSYKRQACPCMPRIITFEEGKVESIRGRKDSSQGPRFGIQDRRGWFLASCPSPPAAMIIDWFKF